MTWFTKTTKTYSGETTLDQGTDGSSEYLKSRQIRLILGHHNTGATVSFKPFLTKYSMVISSEHIDETKEYFNMKDYKTFTNKSIGMEVSFGLELLAHSVNEAKVNMMRVNELDRMYRSLINTSTGTSWALRNIWYVSMANLLTATYTSKRAINSFSELKSLGVPCFMEGYSFSIDKDMGMFEDGASLLPRKYTLELKFKISNPAYGIANGNNKYLWLPMEKQKEMGYNYRPNDTGTFPFGIDSWGSRIGTDGGLEYSGNNNSIVYIAGPSGENGNMGFFAFDKPFDFSMDWKYSYHNAKVVTKEHTGGGLQIGGSDGWSTKVDINNNVKFSIINHSVNEARNNMLKLQQLIRFVDQYYPNSTDPIAGPVWNQSERTQNAPRMYMIFNNINSRSFKDKARMYNRNEVAAVAKEYIIKGLSFDFDLSMGLFEDGGLLYFKKYDISLDLLLNGANEIPYEMNGSQSGRDKPVTVKGETKDKHGRPNIYNSINHKIFN